MAKVYDKRPCNLLSSSISQSEDDWYPYYHVAMLFMHEGLRRDLSRVKKAADNYNPVDNPWSASYMQEFLLEYLLPVVELHDLNEDEVIWPYYASLGVIIPDLDGLGNQHDITRTAADNIRRITNVDSVEGTITMKTAVNTLYDHLFRHYAQEEEYLPELIAQNGEKVYFTVLQKVVTSNWSAGRGKIPANRMFLAAMFDAAGYDFRNKIRLEQDIEDTPWCSEDLLDQIIANQGLYVRFLPLPDWFAQYQEIKLKIRSVAVGRDLLKECPPEAPKSDFFSCCTLN